MKRFLACERNVPGDSPVNGRDETEANKCSLAAC